MLNAVTQHSLEILDSSLAEVERSLSSIVAAFEEIRATSGSTASNADRIEGMMDEILQGNAGANQDIQDRMKDVDSGVADGQGNRLACSTISSRRRRAWPA